MTEPACRVLSRFSRSRLPHGALAVVFSELTAPFAQVTTPLGSTGVPTQASGLILVRLALQHFDCIFLTASRELSSLGLGGQCRSGSCHGCETLSERNGCWEATSSQ